MDPNANPFNPGAGTPPPELVGRDPILLQADTVLERIKRGRSERSLLLVGLRGVGKTVLLREFRRRALDKAYAVEMLEAQEQQTLAQLLVPALRRLLLDLDGAKRTIATVKRGLRVLRSFLATIKVKTGEVEVTLGVDPERGRADSGDLESDLKDMLIALGEAARDTQRPIANPHRRERGPASDAPGAGGVGPSIFSRPLRSSDARRARIFARPR